MIRFLSSIQLAVVLIASIAGLCAASTLYGLPDLFSSLPFRVLMVLFFVNLFLCSVKLWPKLWRTLRLTPQDTSKRGMMTSSLDEEAFYKKLAEQRFFVRKKEEANGTFVLAVKNRLNLLAPHILHIGLLIIVLGSFWTTFETEGQMSLGPGQQKALPDNIAARVGDGELLVEDFQTAYDDQGAVENWITTFDLSLAGKQVADNATTRVNEPYKVKGLSIYQMAYSNHHLITFAGNADFEGTYAFPENQPIPIGGESFRVTPMTKDLPLFMVYNSNDEVIHQGVLKEDTHYQFSNGANLSYEGPYSFTVLQLKYNPALPLVFLGFLVLGIASLLLLIGRYQEVWAWVPKQGDVQCGTYCKQKNIQVQLKEDLGISSDLISSDLKEREMSSSC